MGKQHRITNPCELMDENGLLLHPGYATKPFWRYDRRKIRASWHRIKEWDYYCVVSPENGCCITFTLADLGYIGLAAVCWLDIRNRVFRQTDTMSLLPRGRMGLPAGSGDGTTCFKDRKMMLEYRVAGPHRKIRFNVPAFIGPAGEKGLAGELDLYHDPDTDTMAIATAWPENPRTFYYNHKINCMPARGWATMGTRTVEFLPENSFGTLDWGRGNWTYKNRWYWGSASGLLHGDPFGWNIGYGFSDRSVASENMLFYKGRAHKLDQVTFHPDTADYLAPWKFTSSDHRFELDFEPVVDRSGTTDFIFIKSVQHQVFGYFSGDVVLDDGTRLHLDRFFGFAEDVLNWW